MRRKKSSNSNEDIREILTLDKSLGQQGKHLVNIEVHVFEIQQLDLVLLLLVIKNEEQNSHGEWIVLEISKVNK